jgi:cytoskeletal protein CcmA (bactofilin family)
VTVIAAGTSFSGEIVSDDPIEVHGRLEGDARTTARFVVGETGSMLGNIEAGSVVIAGEVTAGIISAQKVELQSTARVSGFVRAGVLSIADGAVLEGCSDPLQGLRS